MQQLPKRGFTSNCPYACFMNEVQRHFNRNPQVAFEKQVRHKIKSQTWNATSVECDKGIIKDSVHITMHQ